MSELIENIIDSISSCLWGIFLPLILLFSFIVICKTVKSLNRVSRKDKSKWQLSKVKSSFSISLSSKIGTGAIIGVLAAMWKSSHNGVGGESIVLWVLIGVLIFVPITYSEVLYTQITQKRPREFISFFLNTKLGSIYAISLVILYSFGFVGFQFTGIISAAKLILFETFNYNINNEKIFIFILIPLLIFVAAVVLTKNHLLFVNILGSLISIVILSYLLLSLYFFIKTIAYFPQYLTYVIDDFLKFKSAALGLPIGCIVGFQRIIQTGETGLGTSALASSDANNSPRREALIQTLSTIATIFIAVAISTYVFSYGINNITNISLTGNGLDRISNYLYTILHVTGYTGIGIISIFFILSGLTTILGSFHYLNNSLKCGESRRILCYILLVSSAGILSIINFDIIFNAADLLMFIIVTINLSSIFIFIYRKISNYYIND